MKEVITIFGAVRGADGQKILAGKHGIVTDKAYKEYKKNGQVLDVIRAEPVDDQTTKTDGGAEKDQDKTGSSDPTFL